MVDQQEFQRRLQDVIQRAEAGDANAQYSLAILFSRTDPSRALSWLQKAADQSHAGAVFMLGGWYVQGTVLAQDLEQGIKLLQKASNLNFPDADIMLASLAANGAGIKPDWRVAVSLIVNSAQNGVARALCQLAFLLEMTRDKEAAKVAAMLLEAAAERWDMLALYAWAKRTLTAKVAQEDHDRGLLYMALAAKNGNHPLALRYPGIGAVQIPRTLPPPKIDLAKVDWPKVETFLPEPPVPKAPEETLLNEAPFIATYPGFLTEDESDYVIGMAVRYLAPSQVIDPRSGKPISNPLRSSHDMRFSPALQDLVIFCITCRIAEITGEPRENQEMLGVLRYEPGQQYKPHGDYLTPDSTGKNEELEASGQRIKTFLVYLNDDYNGGETGFPRLGIKARGNKGDGLMFINVDDKGAPDPLTIHAGCPVEEGVKWLSTIWIRAREYHYIKPESK